MRISGRGGTGAGIGQSPLSAAAAASQAAIKSGDCRARVAPMPLQPVVDAVVAQGRPEAEAKGLELTRVPTRLWVRADRAILERIVGNLVSNAIRYTERGRVVIGIRRGRDTCDVVVADTGIGISAADRTRIFDEFYQVGNPERNRSKGFGLGLAIVRRLCFAMKYRIEVDGGVNVETGRRCRDAGTDTLVAGSAFFKAADKAAFIRELTA